MICQFNIQIFFPPQIPVGSCSVYDPVFSESECDALKELGFTVLTENEVHTSTDLKNAFVLRSVFKHYFHNRRESERLINPPCFT